VAHLIRTDGIVIRVAPANGKVFTLEELQGFVGGYIEAVPMHHLGEGVWMVCNEQGKLIELAHNPAASSLAQLPVNGDVLFARFAELEEEYQPENDKEQ
jgi:hypothetical protein